ncbi:leucine-rich repeat domain-containing protein [Streptomyces sp. 3MP-14]|uniref:Leucine-rich repeat domain-containing protein n=1 Tax=Streptomyces mimosae TaxID=2586635 RepID=A0A5N6ALT5_9ACTN|nr:MULTISPECIES: STM4015 family protein [Streptomyces]KAB8168870.1 leucine-rich repeat domain-containing protein [Streptomyces mimosae]KAB8177851.1 leucine-rich repeat domain-containing protein [Streptomyces sp. 3MP-14]
MTIGSHLEEFYGLPAVDFPEEAEGPEGPAALPAADEAAWRVAIPSWDAKEEWPAAFARFLATVDTTRVRALIVGSWGESYENRPTAVISAILDARERLPALRAVFLGDIVMEEAEISWIYQGRVSDLLEGFPELEEFGVRGGTELEFAPVRHERLRKLVVETGGMPAEAVRGVGASEFPALTHLELWLGTPEYGGNSEVTDLMPILAGERLPALKHLALCNSEMQDAVCAAVASAPVVARLETLDLSMGVLTDDGASALLTGQPLTHLTSLDLSYNFLSEALRTRLRETLEPAGVELDLDADGAEEDEDGDGDVWRFVAVGE